MRAHRSDFIDRVGLVYGRWTVIREADDSAIKNVRWLCRCECGVERSVNGRGLATGDSSSCGCLARENVAKRCTKHGQHDSRAYCTWRNMLSRCQNPNAINFHNYGGRGITVCERWLKFENFLADMGHPPVGMSIERKENNGNYEPGNCVWATMREQLSNTRRNHFITHNGLTMTVSQWGLHLGGNVASVNARLQLGWDEKRAVTEPLQKHKNRRAGSPD